MDIVIHAKGYILPYIIVFFREISWINMESGIAKTIFVFTPDY